MPFPEPGIVEALPWHRQLLAGLLGADAIGFHTSGYAVRFIESCGELLGCDIDSEPGAVIHHGRKTVVRSRPIGFRDARAQITTVTFSAARVRAV